MRIGGHSIRDHLRLLAPLLGLVALAWFLRLLLSAADASPMLVRVASVTGAATLAVLLAVAFIHLRRFGGYANVVMVSFLTVAWGQLLIVLAIIFSVVTSSDNIFTAPEYSVPGDSQYHIRHILGHLTFGLGAGTIVGAAAGCFLLWLLRLLLPLRSDYKSSQEGN